MKQTNLLSCRLGTFRTGIIKSFGLMSLSLMFYFVLGTQNVTAQTMEDIGELRAEQTIKLVQGEVEFLEGELKNPSANSDLNGQLIAYYDAAIRRFKNGGDFKIAIRDTRPLNTSINGNSGTSSFQTSNGGMMVISESSEFGLLLKKIDELDISDDDDSDLIAIFNYLRTLKNQ